MRLTSTNGFSAFHVARQLLQVRCAVYNGTLDSDLGQIFHLDNDRLLQAAIAA